MPLFKLPKVKVEKVRSVPFESEATLQAFFDPKLEELLGVRFIEAQYNIPNGRIDTLGIDELNVPVAVEYKLKQDPGAIVFTGTSTSLTIG